MVVNDQYGCLIWICILVEFMIYLVENCKEFGYYYLLNDVIEDIIWYDFVVEILKDIDVEIKLVDLS